MSCSVPKQLAPRFFIIISFIDLAEHTTSQSIGLKLCLSTGLRLNMEYCLLLVLLITTFDGSHPLRRVVDGVGSYS